MKIAAIVAVSENGVIGINGQLPWENIPEDLKRFKELTTGHAVIMGRRTWESLPVKPLPGRTNIVVTNSKGRYGLDSSIAMNLDCAIYYASDCEKAFLIGGEQIYREGLQYCDEVYLTRVHETVEYGPEDVVVRIDFLGMMLANGKWDSEELGQTQDGKTSFYKYSRVR